MMKRLVAMMLALCLLLTSSVALMEENSDALLAAAEVVTDELDAPVEEEGEFELGEGLELDEEEEEGLEVEASEPVADEPAEETAEAEAQPETAEPAETEETAEPVVEATAEPVVETTAEPVVEAAAEPVVVAPAETADKTVIAAAATTTQFTLTGNAKTTVNVGSYLQINLAAGVTAKSYKSSKKKIAVVSGTGLVTPKAKGKAKITVTLTNKKKLKLTLTVNDPTLPTSVYLSKGGARVSGTITVNKGTSIQLVPVLNSTVARTTYKWKSSKKKVATASGAGVITAKKEGTTKITVTTVRGKKKASIKVKVIDPYKATAVRINRTGLVLVPLGSPVQLGAVMTPANSTSKLTWKSSKKKIATVSKTGVVTGKKLGKAKITVTTSTKKKASITVQVVAKLQPAKTLKVLVPSGAEKIQRFRTVGFQADVSPYPSNANLVWTSANPNIVKVSKYYRSDDFTYQGELTGVNEGTTKITVRDTVTGLTTAFSVQCFEPAAPVSVTFPSGNITITRGQNKTSCPAHIKLNKSGSWDAVVLYQVKDTAGNINGCEHSANCATVTMSNPAIAAISYDSANGNHIEGACAHDYYLHINALAAGTSTVTLTLKNGKSASFTLTVK